MARAKRTDRTEARRRYREDQASVAASETDAAAAAIPAGSTGSSGSKAAARSTAPAPERPSIGSAFRNAFRPVDLVGDLKALPKLLVHWSFWGPALATIGSTVLYLVASQGRTASTAANSDTLWVVVNLAFQMFVFPLPAPAGASFIAGFGARRAAWLVGVLIGLIAAACFAVILLSVSSTLTTGGAVVDVQTYALQGFLVAPVGSALFAAAAAWYKRFLNAANPNRNQARRAPTQKTQGRGDIKRDRLSR